MSHSYAQNHIHLVFSTKNREKVFARDFLPRLWACTAAICKNHDLLTFAVGGMDDHLHLLFRLPPTMTLANAVALVKSNSSTWIKEQRKSFAWQEGYGAFIPLCVLLCPTAGWSRSLDLRLKLINPPALAAEVHRARIHMP